MATAATPKKRRPDWRPVFLAKLRDTANVRLACKAADVHRSVAYRTRERSTTFAAAWDEALEEACDVLEAYARERATVGVEEPVYQGGKQVGTLRRVDTTLLIFLLKAHRPERYRERFDHRHSGPAGLPLGVDLTKLSPKELTDLEALIAKAESGSASQPR